MQQPPRGETETLVCRLKTAITCCDSHLQIDVGVPDADLHGQHLRCRVVLQEVGQVSQCGHPEAGLVTTELQPQEAVALGQWGVSGSAGPALQEPTHLGAAGAIGQAALAACEDQAEAGVSFSISVLSAACMWR